MRRVAANLVLIVLAVLTALPAHAVVVDGFFGEEVPVEDQSSGERLRAFSGAMESVLQRLSGVPIEQTEDSRWRDIVNNASRYVERYNYRKTEDETGFYLQTQFSAQPLQALLMDRGLPVWPVNRQPVVLWLVVNAGSRQLLHQDDSADSVYEAVAHAAHGWGLPLQWPASSDVGHREGVASSDVTGEFDERLLKTSKHYGSGPVVAATLERQSGTWVLDWRWLNAERGVEEGRYAAAEQEEAINGGVAALSQRIAAASSVVLGTEAVKELRLEIDGVQSIDDVARIRAQLNDWLVVQSVREVMVRPQHLSLSVVLQGGRRELLERLQQSGHFESLENESVSVSIEPLGKTTDVSSDAQQPSPTVKLRWLGAR
ncbi:hypothetical protein GP5015_1320 [gamma proteobacterium HTCC5015]|nr:hypothetical protein GP5015_1320 [gamma proteobacterium HTCC5015]